MAYFFCSYPTVMECYINRILHGRGVRPEGQRGWEWTNIFSRQIGKKKQGDSVLNGWKFISIHEFGLKKSSNFNGVMEIE